MKLTLGMLWSLFKRLRIEVISEEGESSEMGLLAWLKKMTADYDGVEIKNFKERYIFFYLFIFFFKLFILCHKYSYFLFFYFF